jgi:hypothetical protein
VLWREIPRYPQIRLIILPFRFTIKIFNVGIVSRHIIQSLAVLHHLFAYALSRFKEFGFESVGPTAADFETMNMVVQLGVPPVRVDIVTSLTGVSREEVYENRTAGKYGDVSVFYIGRDRLISNNRAMGRRELADLKAHGEE